MGVTYQEIQEARSDYRYALLDLETAINERVLEELENGASPELAIARARVACDSLAADAAHRAQAVENLEIEYQANADAELIARKYVRLLERRISEGSS